MRIRRKKPIRCLNCHHRIGNVNFCPHCGQENSDRKISLKQMIHDFLGDYFTFDSKFFHSVIPLIVKPGHLTREYVTGRRVRYILPLRLYLFTTFVFFFVITINTKLDRQRRDTGQPAFPAAVNDSLKTVLDEYRDSVPSDVREKIIQRFRVLSDSSETGGDEPGNMQFKFGDKEVHEDRNRFERYLKRKADYISDLGDQGKALLVKEIINQIPKILFLMLPFFALILKLLYIRHRIFYVEHFIFALHLHTFAFFLLILTAFFTKWYTVLPIVFVILVYLFLSMKRFYGQSFLKTLLKSYLLLTLYSLAFLPAAILLVILAIVSV